MKFFSLIILSLTLLFSAAVLHAQSDQKKELVPTGQTLDDAYALIKEIYKSDFDFAQTPERKIVLVRKLLQGATNEQGANRYALLAKARDTAIEIGDVDDCRTALNAIEESFDVDGLKARNIAYAALLANIRTPDDRTKLAQDLSTTVQAALVMDRFDIAKSVAEVGLTNAKRADDPELRKQAMNELRAVRETEVAFADVRQDLVILAEKPSDPAASLKVGKYRCFIKDDWQNGLPMLAQSSDISLKALAARDIAGASFSGDQVNLGDGWWDVAEKLSGVSKRNAQSHAATWYLAALPSMEKGLSKMKAETRINDVQAGSE